MGIKPNFTRKDIQNINQKFADNVIITIEKVLKRSIIDVVNFAKNTDTYIDRTNNLRSSIGYVLYKDGQKISASFEKAGEGGEGDGAFGVERGSNYAEEIAEKFSNGYVVVLVAGMTYAAYVEMKSYDVITGASNQLDPTIKKHFEDAKNAIQEQTGIDLNLI